jgi:hypothetical protein
VSIGSISTGDFDRGYNPGAVSPAVRPSHPIPRQELTDPNEPIPFGDFLLGRNRVEREAEVDSLRLLDRLGCTCRPNQTPDTSKASSNMPNLMPKIGEVLPVKPEPKVQEVVRKQVLERQVMTGRIMDVVM